jgi:hypothetical protein
MQNMLNRLDRVLNLFVHFLQEDLFTLVRLADKTLGRHGFDVCTGVKAPNDPVGPDSKGQRELRPLPVNYIVRGRSVEKRV